jgi:hypothetical protein
MGCQPLDDGVQVSVVQLLQGLEGVDMNSGTLGMKHLLWIDCHIHMSGFRTDSDSYHEVVA